MYIMTIDKKKEKKEEEGFVLKTLKKKKGKKLSFKKTLIWKKLHFKERGGKRFLKKHFLRIVCRGNVLPKHIYFMETLIMRKIKKQH